MEAPVALDEKRRMTFRPQRIAYLLQMADLTSENGIAKKIREQVMAWREHGATVKLFSLVASADRWDGLDKLEMELVVRGGAATRVWRSYKLCQDIRAWKPDIIYFRYAYHSPGLTGLFNQFPTVAEINSDDSTEYALTLGRTKQFYHRLTRDRILRAVSGFVPVTHELGRRMAKFRHPAQVIANGINLASFAVLPAAAATHPIHLAFVGSANTPWHGLDRIAELARLLPAMIFDIIGCTLDDWRAAAPNNLSPPPPNLIFHGQLAHAGYEPILCNATAALGTFGLYRKQMDEACPLKVREYLALGLPVIGAYHDTDVPETADYYCQLPNHAGSLATQFRRVEDFIKRWLGRRVSRSSIEHLDTRAKEPRRLNFMAQIAADFHAGQMP